MTATFFGSGGQDLQRVEHDGVGKPSWPLAVHSETCSRFAGLPVGGIDGRRAVVGRECPKGSGDGVLTLITRAMSSCQKPRLSWGEIGLLETLGRCR